MSTAVLIQDKPTPAGRAAVAKAASLLRRAGYRTARLPSGAERGSVARFGQVDFVLVSADRRVVLGEVKRSRSAFPHACVLVALDVLDPTAASKVYGAGATVVAPAEGFTAAVRNILSAAPIRKVLPITEVEESHWSTTGPRAAPVTRHPIEEAIVEGFHDPGTGRLDATRVAEAFGLSLSAIARAVGVTQSALSKRPTASAAQRGLRELEFAWATLLDLLATGERVRAWLNAKRRDLHDEAPISLLTEGAASSLANYVRSVVAGEPG